MACDVWPAIWPCDVTCLSPTVTGQALQIATEIVGGLTGRQFGLCTGTHRPCRQECMEYGPIGEWVSWSYPMPVLMNGQWFNLICGACGDSCSCGTLSQVVMPGPVNSITQIKIGGSVLVTGAYRVDDYTKLVRTDGGVWPRCQDMSLPDTAANTWSITATYGIPVPYAGQLAVGEMACELAKALNNESCRLPRNVTSVNRQGVSINYGEIFKTMLHEGRLTGLYLVDQFIQIYNPNRLMARAKTYSVDQPAARRQTS